VKRCACDAVRQRCRTTVTPNWGWGLERASGQPGGRHPRRPLEDVGRITADQVAALARFVDQCDPEVLRQLLSMLGVAWPAALRGERRSARRRPATAPTRAHRPWQTARLLSSPAASGR
jgi:hypothetical protein